MTEPKPNIYQRINAIMSEVTGVHKGRTNQHSRYQYAGHEDVTAALRHLYVKHGVVRYGDVTETVRANGLLRLHVAVHFVNIDDPKDEIVSNMIGEEPATASKGAATAQQSGVALSYAIKNAEFKLFALKGDDSPDPEDLEQPDPDEPLEDYVKSFSACKSAAEVEAVIARVTLNARRLGDSRAVVKQAAVEAKKRFAERQPGEDG